MRLPKDLLTNTYKKPNLFLCQTDKTKICQLETYDMKASLKFNAYSELSFTVGRTYTNMITGETQVNPFYDKIEALRLLYLEGFGYFEIQDPEIVSDGIKEVKNVTAYSLEYTLSQKYLENFNVNTGEIDSIEVIQANGGLIVPVTLYNESNPKLSLLNLALEKIYGWTIGHVDLSLQTMGRTFEISRASVYDFIVQDICDKFNCFAVFDTINNTINLYSEALITRHIGDGITKTFTVSPAYGSIGSVSINSYKTTAYQYEITIKNNIEVGLLTFDFPPENGAKIEITDGEQEQWATDVYVSFDNLAQEVNISYSADDIKTVLTVKGADDIGITEVNMGLPYIVDLSYYYSVDWMGQDLYDAYTEYLKKCNLVRDEYRENHERMSELDGIISYEQGRVSLQYSEADNITSTTVGTYYVRGGSYPDYYYTEVKLPDDWKSNMKYYTLSGSDLDINKFDNLYFALISYFASQADKDISKIEELKDSFSFMDAYTIDDFINNLSVSDTLEQKKKVINDFLDELLNQLGLLSLNNYLAVYTDAYQSIIKEAGYDNPSNENYWRYYTVVIFVDALKTEIAEREAEIKKYQDEYDILLSTNQSISNSIVLDVFFENYFVDKGFNKDVAKQHALQLLIKLSPFLREDEYTDDNFVITEIDTIKTKTQVKQELLECGRIELSKLCEPKLEFSMDMANIYALPEFEPIIDQFQLGKLINVVIRSDYKKRARLLAVNISFDNFSDFSCEFGELTNLRTPSSIHADLLSSALSAGKTVASSASYWNKSSDVATSLGLLLQQGLLDSSIAIKAIDGNQGVSIDKYGIHLRKIDPDTGVADPKEGWIINNQFLYSDNNFADGSVKSVFGEYVIDGQTKWGLLAEAIMAGYVAGCTIEGGTIKIGLQDDGTYAFEVRQDGSVIMNGGSTIAGYVTEEDLIEIRDTATIISDVTPINANEGQLWLNTSTNPYSLMVFTNGEWVYFSQQNGGQIHTSKPSVYSPGDLWILSNGELYPEVNPIYSTGSILKANENLEWIDAMPYITTTISNVQQYFEFNKNDGLKIGQKDQKFYVNISSTRMSFYDKSDGENEAERERDPDEVVYISNKSAVMKKLIVEEDAMFESPASFEKEINMYKPNTTIGFTWKIEQNGSLSLAITS